MSWDQAATLALSVFGALCGLVVALSQALGRETLGELKRRVGLLEADKILLTTQTSALGSEVGILKERSTGMKQQLDRIESSMVQRQEWEAKHKATDENIERALYLLERMRDTAQEDPHPGRRRGDPLPR